jgi:hypothetical protein
LEGGRATLIELLEEKLSATERRMIESISYTESGKPNIKLVSKEFAHRELRRMIGGDKEAGNTGTSGTFSNYSDAELFAELSRLRMSSASR